MTATLDTTPRLKRPDDIYQALMDAQKAMTAHEADLFRARLVLLLANQVGDDAVVLADLRDELPLRALFEAPTVRGT